MRIIAFFNLKSDADIDAYEEWARTRDLPGVRALPSVTDFQVLRTTGVLFSDAKPPFQYIEVMDVDDLDAFLGDCGTDAVGKLAAEMAAHAADVTFITTERLPEVA